MQAGEASVRSIRLPLVSMRPAFGGSAATWVLMQQVRRARTRGGQISCDRPHARAGGDRQRQRRVARGGDCRSAERYRVSRRRWCRRRARRRARELGAVWTTLTARGALIALLLVALAPLMNAQFHLGGSLVLLQLAAVLPLLRGLASPAYYIVQRERRFQHLAGVEIVGGVRRLRDRPRLRVGRRGRVCGADRPGRRRKPEDRADLDHDEAASADSRSRGPASATT